jgi:glycerophosphoryl diester phosphodiesterase
MQQRLPSLLDVPITFAHRGARADAVENTIEAFQLALELGAGGLESDVWLTRDGVAVLDHDGTFGRMRKRRIGEIDRDDLPARIPTVAELIQTCGTGYHLSLDLKDPSSGPTIIETIGNVEPELLERTWLCHHDLDLLAGLRRDHQTVRLVNSTRLARLGESPERRAARLAELGIDGVNLRKEDWNGGLVTLFHRFQRTAFAWDLQHDYELRPALRMGIDGVYSDFVERMMTVFRDEIGEQPTS